MADRLYEVRVKVNKGIKEYNSSFSQYVYNTVIKAVHIFAPDGKRARKRARRYGQPLTAHKVDIQDIMGSMESLDFEKTQPVSGIAIARDEMIWKQKRHKRIKNREKDKKGY